jgi:phosphopantetheinyl transferase
MLASAAQLTEDTEELKQRLWPCLLPDEKNYFEKIKHPKRKREWLGVRVLLAEELGEYPGMSYNSDGKPVLSDERKVSLTHSDNCVAFAISNDICPGADIEIIGDKIQRLAHKFTFPDKIPAKYAEDNKKYLYTVWCAKETLFKIYSRGNLDFKKQLFIQADEISEKGSFLGEIKTSDFNEKYRIHYAFIKQKEREIIFTYSFGL